MWMAQLEDRSSRREHLLEAFARSPTDAYWASQVLYACRRDGFHGHKEWSLYARAVACVASQDPWQIVVGPLSRVTEMFIARGVATNLLRRAIVAARCKRSSDTAFFRGRLWAASIREPITLRERRTRAAAALRELGRVDPAERRVEYWEAATGASAWADNAWFPACAEALVEANIGEERTLALLFILRTAMRCKNWAAYDSFRGRFPQVAARMPAHARALANLDGLRWLRVGEGAKARQALVRLLGLPKKAAFFGTPDTLEFLIEMGNRGIMVDECREYIRRAAAFWDMTPALDRKLRALMVPPP